ncbi:hypothetical protein F5883DRAFT_155976 [Diaporthe sp. PMI_573]|nr:hypothetical protein F5883DRAFT_155976 [Diaporthaceae sp. PMI_573]
MLQEARRPLGEQDTHTSPRRRPGQCRSTHSPGPPVLDSTGLALGTLPWPASPRRATPAAFPTTSFGSFPCLGPARDPLPLRLRACKLALSQAAANRLSPPQPSKRLVPPRPQLCRACLSSYLCFCVAGRHAPYLVVGNCPPAPGPQSTTIISPSVHQASQPPHPLPHSSSSIVPSPPAPKPTRAEGRKEGAREGREGITRPRLCLCPRLRGRQVAPRRQSTSTSTRPIPRFKPDFSS